MVDQKYAKLENDAYLRVSLDKNGDPRRFLNLKTQLAKQYAAYILINKDIELVVEAIAQSRASDHVPIISQSLAFFSIITYAKCFTKNTGRGASLEFDAIFKNAEEEIITEHKRILNLRNDYIAHAGSSFERCVVTATIFMEIGGMHLEGNLSYVTNIADKLDTFLKLCEYVQGHVGNKINVLQQKIFEYFQSLTIEEIMAQAIFPEMNKLFVLEKEPNKMSYVITPFKPI